MVAPILNIPVGVKQTGQRVDFKPEQFELIIETKGYLLAWTRAGICPCISPSDGTQQPDPNCSICDGQGLTYFGTSTPQDLTDYTFTDLQQSIIDDQNAMIIRGVITNITNTQDRIDQISNWVEGDANLTVRADNKLGYLDRVVGLDCKIAYTERLEADGTSTLSTRYPVIEMNQLRSYSSVYVLDTDFEIAIDGSITWLTGPPEVDTVLSAHYLCHPTWIIINHPHAARVSSRLYKTPTPTTPTGDPIDLPVQAVIRYEFLPFEG